MDGVASDLSSDLSTLRSKTGSLPLRDSNGSFCCVGFSYSRNTRIKAFRSFAIHIGRLKFPPKSNGYCGQQILSEQPVLRQVGREVSFRKT